MVHNDLISTDFPLLAKKKKKDKNLPAYVSHQEYEIFVPFRALSLPM